MIGRVYRRGPTPATTLPSVAPLGRHAIPQGDRELRFRPGAQRGLLSGRRQYRRVVRVCAEPGRGPAHRVGDEEIEALVRELRPPGGLDVVGLGGEADDHLTRPTPCADLPHDVRRWLEDELRYAVLLLQFVIGGGGWAGGGRPRRPHHPGGGRVGG